MQNSKLYALTQLLTDGTNRIGILEIVEELTKTLKPLGIKVKHTQESHEEPSWDIITLVMPRMEDKLSELDKVLLYGIMGLWGEIANSNVGPAFYYECPMGEWTEHTVSHHYKFYNHYGS